MELMEVGFRRDGYPALAEWVARDPDHETFVFRRFDRLAARNLLNLQSELVAIEDKLDRMDEDSRLRRDVGLRCWETFAEEVEDQDNHGHAKERRRLYDELERRVKDYQEALLRQSQISQLLRPRQRPLSIFRDRFHGKNQPENAMPILVGQAQRVLDSEQDLLALKSALDTDVVSRFLQDHWPARGKQFHPTHSTTYFREKHVSWIVGTISTIAAAALLIGSIAVLNVVTDQNRRLGCIAGFTLLFALSVVLLSNAKRVEVFAATAAYAAVLVVFMSNNQIQPG